MYHIQRPNYFTGNLSNYDQRNMTFGKPNWFEDSRSEHLACREAVAIFDQSSFAKLLIQGRDACQYLQRLCSNDLDIAIGKIVYTGMLNDNGGMVSEFNIELIDYLAVFLVTLLHIYSIANLLHRKQIAPLQELVSTSFC